MYCPNHTGTIPTSLGTCTNLTSFSVAETYGTLYGGIPSELAQLKNLTHLDLGGNRINGTNLASLGQLKNLQVLNLSHNLISGKIPDEIFETTNLRHLYLQHNRITGTIPRSIESCEELVELRVSDNTLNGTIPSSLPRKLQVIRFDRNDFTGHLPGESIRNMSNLVEFHADRNRFEGDVHNTFSNALSLEIINLAHNKLNGSVRSVTHSSSKMLLTTYHRMLRHNIIEQVPMLRNLKNLTQIILRDNEFDRVQSNSFAGDESLIFLDLSKQQSSSLVLETHSFANIPSSTNLIFTGSSIPVISSNAFQSRENTNLDLSALSIHTLAPYAFNGAFFVLLERTFL